MITKDYFEKHFKEQLKSVGSNPSVIFHLHSSVQLIIHSIEAHEEGYVLVDVYPEPKLDEKYEKRDRMAIAYESIGEIQITLSKQKEVDQMGFYAK